MSCPSRLAASVVAVLLVLLAAPVARAGIGQGFAPAPALVRATTAGLAGAATELDRVVRRDVRARRHAEAHRLRRSPTPEATVRRAWLLGVTARGTYDVQRAVLRRARVTAAALRGPRGDAQRDAVAAVDRLAAAGLLTADRLRPVLLTLSRNTDWWTRHAAPPPGRSVVRGDGPVTLRYVPGQGLVLHQLASWSLVDWLAGACLRDRVHCPRRRLRAAVDTMMRLAVRRDGVVRAESYFPFGAAPAPWISAMTQGGMIQALTRSSVVLHSAPDRRRARAALGAFDRPPPQGVSVPAPGGRHYLMYSTAPRLRILNGDLHALTGLRDLATLGGSRHAARAFRRGERAARRQLRAADTGAWSRYADGGPEATLGYHELATGFLTDLCDRHAGRRYCAAGRRFRRYVREPTRVMVHPPAAPRALADAGVRVWISKVSLVRLEVRDRSGRVVARRAAQLPRGSHRFAWGPPHPGRFTVRVTALGPGAPTAGQAAAVVRARRSAAQDARRAKARARARRRQGRPHGGHAARRPG